MVDVAATAAVAGATAQGAFGYNRANYMFDQGLRFGRFNTGYSMAQAQASMYREDIRDLTTLTVTKQDTYHTVGTIFFVLNFQLIMAGRLGVHGPSPPGWLLGLYWTNICSALMFLVTFTWMAMHASARATAGGAYMLTRSVRLPIPTPKMLDKARKTGNTFEKQRVADAFRIPFAMPAPKETEEDPEKGWRVPVSDRKIPNWYQDEVKELRKDEGGPAPTEESNPEHFELYRGLQEEWWAFDVYSRIGVLFFMSHWLTSASLYSMCHVFSELRCVWPAYTVVACFVLAHRGVLSLDIVSKPREGGPMGVPVEKVVPFVPFLAVVGMTIEYSVLDPSPVWTGIIYFLSWIAYIIQFAWALRLYDLASPRVQNKEKQEVPGQAWWPSEWALPPAFEDAIYLVSAPKHSEQPCLQQEMKAAKGKKGHETPKKRAKQAPPQTFPWKLFRGAIITTISMWLLIMVGRAFEMVNGERWLLKQENRVERWPSHYQPWMAPWTRKGSRNEWCHAGGCDRRLSPAELQKHQDAIATAQRLASALGPIADALEALTTTATTAPPQADAAPLVGAKVSWPAQLRPAMLAARGASLLALARERDGAVLGARAGEQPTPFVLDGIDHLGEIMGAHWGHAGLTLAMTSGAVAECPGAPDAGEWVCAPVAGAPRLPSGLASAVAGRRGAAGPLQAAVVFEGENTIVLLEAYEDGTWVPAGEIRAPTSAAAPHLSLTPSGEELLISTIDGLVLKHNIAERAAAKQVALPRAIPGAKWHGACSLGGNRVAHLASPLSAAFGEQPELFLSPMAGAAA